MSDKKIDQSMRNMEEFRKSEFPNNPIVYAKNIETGQFICYTIGEHAKQIIEFIKNINKQ